MFEIGHSNAKTLSQQVVSQEQRDTTDKMLSSLTDDRKIIYDYRLSDIISPSLLSLMQDLHFSHLLLLITVYPHLNVLCRNIEFPTIWLNFLKNKRTKGQNKNHKWSIYT